MKQLNTILSGFDPIELAEMDAVRLMDRRDTKFAFALDRLPDLLEQLMPHYRLLSIDSQRISSYRTLYFDTDKLALYMKHQNGALNRYKIRYRQYVESDVGFLEVKFKNNKGRTIKERIKQKEIPLRWNEKCLAFLEQKTPYPPITLEPAIWVNYRRMTLVDKNFKERVTIDIDLEFKNEYTRLKMDNLVIMEVKTGSKNQSQAVKTLRAAHIRPGSLSKYCMGIAGLYAEVKQNNFKEKLLTLNKIIYDNSFKFVSGF